MKKIVATFMVLALIAMHGCTNKEGDSDLDFITPNDTTQSKTQAKRVL